MFDQKAKSKVQTVTHKTALSAFGFSLALKIRPKALCKLDPQPLTGQPNFHACTWMLDKFDRIHTSIMNL